MIVKELMTTSINSVKENTPVSAVISIMKAEDVGVVPVCDIQNHLLGVITDRDIVIRDGFAKTAGEIMTANPVSVSSKTNIHDAALLMSQNGIRRLPVTENEKLVGILALKDLAGRKIFTAEIGHIIYSVSNMRK